MTAQPSKKHVLGQCAMNSVLTIVISYLTDGYQCDKKAVQDKMEFQQTPSSRRIPVDKLRFLLYLTSMRYIFIYVPVVVENHPSGGALSRPSALFDNSISVAV